MSNNHTPKLTYKKPELTEHGKLEDLTLWHNFGWSGWSGWSGWTGWTGWSGGFGGSGGGISVS